MDPVEASGKHSVTRVVGNIGYPGVCLIVAPQSPKIRSLLDRYNIVAHEDYNFQKEDNFKSTTLHLSFTDWTAPLLQSQNRRTVDYAIQYIEAVISVREAGDWVADLNPLVIDFAVLQNTPPTRCPHSEDRRNRNIASGGLMSMDCWEELLDPLEDGIGIFRAHKNWAARLAALSILCQQCYASNVLLCGPDFCSECFQAASSVNEAPQRFWIC